MPARLATITIVFADALRDDPPQESESTRIVERPRTPDRRHATNRSTVIAAGSDRAKIKGRTMWAREQADNVRNPKQ